MLKNKMESEVKEMKEVKEHAGFVVDVEEELSLLGYTATETSSGPGGESVTIYIREANLADDVLGKLYERYSLSLHRAEDTLSATGRTRFFQYPSFKGFYTSRVVRSETGEVTVSHWYTYTFFSETPYGFSVSVVVSGELDGPAPKGNPISCEISPVIYIGPIPLARNQKSRIKELVLKISELFAIRSLSFPKMFPEADVYVLLETRVSRGGLKKSLSSRYLGKAGEVFYAPPPKWEDENSVDEDHDLERDDPWDSDSEEEEFEEEED